MGRAYEFTTSAGNGIIGQNRSMAHYLHFRQARPLLVRCIALTVMASYAMRLASTRLTKPPGAIGFVCFNHGGTAFRSSCLLPAGHAGQSQDISDELPIADTC